MFLKRRTKNIFDEHGKEKPSQGSVKVRSRNWKLDNLKTAVELYKKRRQ